MKVRKIQVIWMLSLLLVLTGCNEVEDASASVNNDPVYKENELLYMTELDYSTVYNEPEFIDLAGAEGALLIEDGGEYVLSGNAGETITVDAHDEIVHLFLNNLNVETVEGPAINIASAGKVIITLMDGTVNTLFDAAYYLDDELAGVISSACDLTINGSGVLYACSYYKDAIYTKDVFKLAGGTVQLKAKRNGIRGNDGIVLLPENLIIESEKNGCQTTNANKENKGALEIQGGKISIVAGEYGLSAVSDVSIWDGIVHINSVIGDIYTEGQQYIAEGTYIHE